jgi:hypothetical protein
MKKNDWILIVSVMLYSFLFYHQGAGINFLIFTILLIASLVAKNKALVLANTWRVAALGSLLSASCLAYYGSNLALVSNIISLSLLSGLSISTKSSVVFSLLFSAYSYVTSFIFMYLDWIERKQREGNLSTNGTFKRFLLISIPILITALFFQLYKASNPLFNEFASKINFNFISIEWIAFTIGGFVLMYGFYYHKQVTELATFDEHGHVNLIAKPHEPFRLFGKEIDLNDENFSGKIMFLLLNLLLLMVNLLDFNFIFINRELPADMTYSEFVHQGTGTMIASIIVAVGIILFYFRSSLNFYAQSKTIKILAYCWIVQNVLMLVSTAFRNDLYIAEYGLTYKRIGVYVYLILAAIGLVTTFVKILKLKSNHFLFRSNGWLFYGVLIIACFVNWDVLIATHNSHIKGHNGKSYLLELSDKVLPHLFAIEQASFDLFKAKESDTFASEGLYSNNHEQELSKKLYYFMEKHKQQGWQSWYLSQHNTLKTLVNMDNSGLIKSLDLSATGIQSLAPVRDFDGIISLRINRNNINLSELSYFPMLKRCEMQNNSLNNLKGIHALAHLEYLDISINQITDFSPLFELKHLKTLVIDKTVHPNVIDQLHSRFPDLTIQLI